MIPDDVRELLEGRNLARDGRVALSLVARENPYRTVTLYLVDVETAGSMSLPFQD